MMNNIFFWGDPHFYHRNIIKYCNRPWNSGFDPNTNEMIITNDDLERMTEDLISNYNSVVGKNDIVWCLGDFCLGPFEKIKEIVSRLNGTIKLIKGNHDNRNNQVYLDCGFCWVYDRSVILSEFIILSHKPILFLKDNFPFFNIHGHVHNSNSFPIYSTCSCNACVEVHDYKPVSYDEIMIEVKELRGESDGFDAEDSKV